MSHDVDLLVASSVQESIKVQQALLNDKNILRLITTVAAELVSALTHGHKILVFGNGGSAADAEHLAAEFVGRFQMERIPLPALALTSNTSILTAIGNDYSYENVFARQVEALGGEGDIALGISTSGKSPNVLKALVAAKAKGMVTLALTGSDGTMLKEVARYCICVPAEATPRIQEAHILILHILSQITELQIFAVPTR